MLLVFAFALAALALGCGGCGRDKHVAEMTKHRGEVGRDTASSLREWRPAFDGAKLATGDGLKTGPSAEARVHLVSGGTIVVSGDTTIRFVTAAPGAAGATAARLSVEAGEASIEADDQALAIETTIGLARIEAGGKLRLQAADGGATRVEVTVGAARIDTEEGGVSLSMGKPIEVAVGGAILERDEADAGPDAREKPALESRDAEAPGVTLEAHGTGVRVKANGTPSWRGLAEGQAQASDGDALEIPSGASVDIRSGARHATLAPGRYVVGGEAGALVKASAGRVEVEATTEDVTVGVPGGVIIAKTGPEVRSRVDAVVAAKETKVTVRQGQAEVHGGGAPETLRAGESATVKPRGGAVVVGRGPERPDFTVRAGESLLVRDPRPPTAVGFDFSSVCPAAAVVSQSNGPAVRGEHKAALSFGPGRHDYAVHCIGPDGVEEKPAATGAVTVATDSARAAIPRLPPSTVVDADGRRYTVLYQNLLPGRRRAVARRSSASSYVLHVDAQRIKGPAKQSLRSGTVGEGTHVVWFETEDGKKRSAETTLVDQVRQRRAGGERARSGRRQLSAGRHREGLRRGRRGLDSERQWRGRSLSTSRSASRRRRRYRRERLRWCFG